MAGCVEDKEISTLRPLTTEELALLNWLLEHGLPGAKTFAPQVEKIRATPWCDCGCPSISLHVENEAPSGTCSFRVISDVLAKTPEGKKMGILLFQDQGKLSILEMYSLDILEGEWRFPVYESLQTWKDIGRSSMKDTKE
jgi:hypothetical protein